MLIMGKHSRLKKCECIIIKELFIIRLKRSISLRLVDNNTKYIYYDGKLKSIQYKDMKLLSSFY